MKHGYTIGFLLSCLIMIAPHGRAQITITRTDIEANILNSQWVLSTDTTSGSFDLGNNRTGQTWNFTRLNLSAATVKKDTTNYVPPAGHFGASSFPTATACVNVHQSQTDTLHGLPNPPFSDTVFTTDFTLAFYFNTQNDGAYNLGYGYRSTVTPTPPPILLSFFHDTSIINAFHPPELGYPLPITYNGITRTATDTLTEFFGATTVTTHQFIMAGAGTVTIQGRAPFDVIRIIDDQITITTTPDTVLRERNRSVRFVGKDLSEIRFEVDTTYTSGVSVTHNYEVSLKIGPAVGVRQTSSIVPENFALMQNYPNPFNPTTDIGYRMPGAGYVTLKIFNTLGQEVAALVNEQQAPGEYHVQWNSSGMPSGVYFYRLQAGNFMQTRSMILAK